MTEKDKIFIIIPVYNESEAIREVISDIQGEGYKNIVLVDDASDHYLAPILADLPGLKILRHQANCGAGAASETGIHYALAAGAEHLVLMDADGQHQANEIGDLLKPVLSGDCDVAIGSRFIDKNKKSNVPMIKKLALFVGFIFTWFVSGVWISDSQNGFKALNRKAASYMKFFFNRFEFCLEIIDLIKVNRLRVVEVPVTVKYTDYSIQKGQRLSNSLTIVYNMLTYKLAKMFFG